MSKRFVRAVVGAFLLVVVVSVAAQTLRGPLFTRPQATLAPVAVEAGEITVTLDRAHSEPISCCRDAAVRPGTSALSTCATSRQTATVGQCGINIDASSARDQRKTNGPYEIAPSVGFPRGAGAGGETGVSETKNSVLVGAVSGRRCAGPSGSTDGIRSTRTTCDEVVKPFGDGASPHRFLRRHVAAAETAAARRRVHDVAVDPEHAAIGSDGGPKPPR